VKNLLILLVAVVSHHTFALNLQAWDFSSNPTYATQDDTMLDKGFIRNNYPWILTASYSYVSKPLTVINKNSGNREAILIDNSQDFTLGFGLRLGKKLLLGINLKGSSVNFNRFF